MHEDAKATLEREYSPSSVAPDYRETVAAYASESAIVLGTRAHRRLAYGAGEDEYSIVFDAASPDRRLMFVFIHGGYWQALSAEDSCFPAARFLARRISYAAVNYTLAPNATIEEIVGQCGCAIERLTREYPDTNLVVAGSSAGAHLAAMQAVRMHESAEMRQRVVCSILISGIYDLRPLTHTYINAPLKLDPIRARIVSPALLPVRHVAPTLVCWGEHETAEFKRQSAEHAERLTQHGVPVERLEVAGRNHFDILFDLANPTSQLGKAVDNLLGGL
ncbi:alpha/beta hydrolase [Burkholderia sp. S-53]|uniref:alpha/beta hydrolase n=1 Tax=Burkholderia sp. S-53 TaxID=2906514 RepID=UPI0021CEBC7B|nr:alpha/beta hydrolase [Burkholderia sp. S-53]UXU89928.1 alpha/beta hydrolase [Burkholderia sp. S-53]